MFLDRPGIFKAALAVGLLYGRPSAAVLAAEELEGSALRGTAVIDGKDNAAISSSSLNDNRRRTNTIFYCPTPTEINYEATFTVRTLIAPVRECTEAEQIGMRNLIDFHFTQLVAYDDLLGEIDFLPVGPSCPVSGSRRYLNSLSSSSVSQQDQQPIEITSSATELSNIDDEEHRKLGFLRPGYSYRGSGSCRSCPLDSKLDERRLAANSPIFVIINTDNHPQEMSYEIQTTSGQVVYSRTSFARANYQYEEVVYLNALQKYRFVVKDSYGDGWCCSHGTGKAAVYAGTDRFDVLLVYVNHNFGAAKTTVFDAPAAPQPSTTTESYISNSAFPELEYEYSNYISYYVQQAYHANTFHCLFGKYPDVWVDLDRAATATPICPP